METRSNCAATLDAAGVSYLLDQSSLKHNYFKVYGNLFPANDNFKVAIAGSSNLAIKEAVAIAESYPNASVSLIVFGIAESPTHDYSSIENLSCWSTNDFEQARIIISSLSDIDFFIEHGNNKKSQKLDMFLNLFMALPPGAHYIIEDLHAVHIKKYEDIPGPNIIEYLARVIKEKAVPELARNQMEYHLASAIESFTNYGKLGIIKRSDCKFMTKIGERSADLYFKVRPKKFFAGAEVFRKKGSYQTRLSFHSNRKEFDSRAKPEVSTPEINIRHYKNVVCAPGQVVACNNVLLPESFRMSAKKIPRNRHLKSVNNFFAFGNYETQKTITGNFLFLDNEVPGHFGHITAEVISKLWAWDGLLAKYPDLKILASSTDGERIKILDEILSIYGIPTDRIFYFNSAVSIENLFCPTQQYHISQYAVPGIEDTWSRIFESGYIDTPLNGKKIFLSRSNNVGRGCENQDEVEQIFKSAGYEIVLPENYGIREQISICGTATEIAGFAGSATLNAVYCKPGIKKIIICSDTFDADNDIVISSLKGDKLYYFWCESSIQHPVNGWSERAFHAPYSFNTNRDGLALREVAGK
jgi:hypothetical protein